MNDFSLFLMHLFISFGVSVKVINETITERATFYISFSNS